MISRPSNFLSAAIWPLLAAVLVAGVLVALLPAQKHAETIVPITRVDMQEAMRILDEEHSQVLDQTDRERSAAERKAQQDAQAFEQARVAAVQEAARKLAEARAAEQRAADKRIAEEKRLAEASVVKVAPKPKPEIIAAGNPLDIVPVTGGESGPLLAEPRGPIDRVVAKVGDVAGEIKNRAVSTVIDIKDWFSTAGDKLLGREKAVTPLPASRLISEY